MSCRQDGMPCRRGRRPPHAPKGAPSRLASGAAGQPSRTVPGSWIGVGTGDARGSKFLQVGWTSSAISNSSIPSLPIFQGSCDLSARIVYLRRFHYSRLARVGRPFTCKHQSWCPPLQRNHQVTPKSSPPSRNGIRLVHTHFLHHISLSTEPLYKIIPPSP